MNGNNNKNKLRILFWSTLGPLLLLTCMGVASLAAVSMLLINRYVRAEASDVIAYEEVYVDAMSGDLCVTVAKEVKDEGGRTKGVTAVDLLRVQEQQDLPAQQERQVHDPYRYRKDCPGQLL